MLRQAVILAGGMGKRLGTLTANTPKPLLKVGGQPFVDYLIKHLTRHGVEHIVLLVGPHESHYRQHFHTQYRQFLFDLVARYAIFHSSIHFVVS